MPTDKAAPTATPRMLTPLSEGNDDIAIGRGDVDVVGDLRHLGDVDRVGDDGEIEAALAALDHTRDTMIEASTVNSLRRTAPPLKSIFEVPTTPPLGPPRLIAASKVALRAAERVTVTSPCAVPIEVVTR